MPRKRRQLTEMQRAVQAALKSGDLAQDLCDRRNGAKLRDGGWRRQPEGHADIAEAYGVAPKTVGLWVETLTRKVYQQRDHRRTPAEGRRVAKLLTEGLTRGEVAAQEGITERRVRTIIDDWLVSKYKPA